MGCSVSEETLAATLTKLIGAQCQGSGVSWTHEPTLAGGHLKM